jgi:hypothetical protein
MPTDPTPFVRLLHAKKTKLDRRLAETDEDTAELLTLIGYAAATTNGSQDKPQAMSEILYLLVLMYAEDKLNAAQSNKDAIEAHAVHCVFKPKIEKIERAVEEMARKKRDLGNAVSKALEVVESLQDGKVKGMLRNVLGFVSVLYPLRYLLMVLVISPHSAPLIAMVIEAIQKGT